MPLIYLNIFFGLIAFLGLIILWFILPPDSPWSPWWRTSSKKAIAAARLAKLSKKDFVCELGSGDANFLITVCQKFGSYGLGIEFDYLRHLIGWLRIKALKLDKRVKLKRGNFYDYNLSKATVIFVYLVPRVLEKLKPKLTQELKKGTRIVSFRYKFKVEKNKKLEFMKYDKKSEMYLYKIA